MAYGYLVTVKSDETKNEIFGTAQVAADYAYVVGGYVQKVAIFQSLLDDLLLKQLGVEVAA